MIVIGSNPNYLLRIVASWDLDCNLKSERVQSSDFFRAGRKDFLIQIMDKTELVFHNFHQINHSEKYLNLKEVIFFFIFF